MLYKDLTKSFKQHHAEYIDRIILLNAVIGINEADLKNILIPFQFENKHVILAPIKDIYGRDVRINPDAYAAFEKMTQEAKTDGVDIQIISAFRTPEYQQELLLRKLNQGIFLSEILSTLAPPGFSEHHTGNALDLTNSTIKTLTNEFDSTLEFQWLKNNAHNFNFYLSYPKNNNLNVIYEPWHWCYKIL